MASIVFSALAKAVRITTGGRFGFSPNRRKTSMPSISGTCRSRRMACTASRSSLAYAACPALDRVQDKVVERPPRLLAIQIDGPDVFGCRRDLEPNALGCRELPMSIAAFLQ